jgi:hypothetical protein
MFVHVSSDAHGPLFDGRAAEAVEDLLTEAEEHVAEMGVRVIQDELDRVLQNPTGYYRSRITSNRASRGALIHDSNVVYGSWLEGISSQNRELGFSGYHTFERMTPVIQARANRLADNLLRVKYLRRMQ